jgi:hypothetical protein
VSSSSARRRRQLATLDALINYGSVKAAAHELGIAESTARKRLAAYCTENRYAHLAQAAYDRAKAMPETHPLTRTRRTNLPFSRN